MGVTVKNLFRLQDLSQLGHFKPGGAIIELGAQELYCKGLEQSVANFLNSFATNQSFLADDELIVKLANRGFTSELFKHSGFSYKALDIFDGDEVILFDLNLETPGLELKGNFDLVTNFGTTEHVINQYASFKTIHELTKQGGIIYHDLPMGGYHTHGYFNYNPLFFQHLASANNYEILFHWYSRSSVYTNAPELMQNNGFGENWTDMGIEYIFLKTTDEPFRMPLETGTSLALNPNVWHGSDPYGKGLLMPAPDSEAQLGQLRALKDARSANISLRLREFSGWDLQREVLKRYKARLTRLLGN